MPLFPVHRDAVSSAFFDGTARGEFLVVRDLRSGEVKDPKTYIPPGSGELELVPASGRGRIISWSVVHSRAADGSNSRTLVGIVQLEEGPWWWGEIDADPDADLLGIAVDATFVASGVGEHDEVLPVFVARREG